MKYLNSPKIPIFLVFFIGCFIGFLSHLSIQDGLYNSQIVVNLMDYGKDDLMYIWGINLWTVMSQVTGFLLAIGINESVQSIILSVVLNGLSFMSLYLILNSISRNSLLSLALVLMTYFSKHYLYGLSYEVSMYSWDFYNSTWGNFGFHFALLSLGLIFSNYLRVGYFLLGAMLSIHFFIGSFFIGTILLANIVTKNNEGIKLKGKWFAYGLFFSVVSYIINYSQYGAIDVGGAQISIDNYITNWDTHRNSSLDYLRSAILTNLFCLFFTGYLFFFKKIRGIFSLSWFFSASVACFVILIFYVLSLIDLFPFLYVAMPERMFNFLYYLSIPTACALAVRRGRSFPVLLFPVIIMFDYFFHFLFFDIVSFCLLILLLLVSVFPIFIKKNYEDKMALGLIGLCIISIGLNSNFKERINNIDKSFYNERNSFLKRSDGMLLVSPMHIASKVQLFTRRKIIMDATELSEISYAFHTYSKANMIMKEIYKIELNDDYKNLFVIHNGVETVSPGYVRKIWENRDPKEWRNLFVKYQISQVLVPSNWNLKIKSVYSDSNDKVYEIN